MDLVQALALSARGMDAQTERLRVIAESLAGRDGRGGIANPRMTALSAGLMACDPGMGVEERSDSVNLGVMRASRSMLTRTIDLLR